MKGLLLVLVVGALSACAIGPGAGGSGAASPGSGGTSDLDRQHQQAQAALDRWARAVAAAGGQQSFSVTGSKTDQVGTWEIAVGDNNKAALYAGMVEAVNPLPDSTPPAGQVRWDDGSVMTVAVESAAAALRDIQTDASACQDCGSLHPLRVTTAVLTNGRVTTSRGPATVPLWEFTVEGTSVLITRVAVAATQTVSVSPPPWDANNAPIGISIDAATMDVSGRVLTVSFVGSPSPAYKPCGADYDGEAVESELAVVVIVIEHRNLTAANVACPAIGALRTTTVQLARPLGDRAVLEVKEGLPVPVTRTGG